MCIAQPINLVPNPGFEIYNTCPFTAGTINYSGIDQICYAIPWFQPNFPSAIIQNGCGGSSDFFHACSGVVPRNVAGYQYPKSGLGYAGIGPYGYQSNDGREYLEIKLDSKLEKRKYCNSFFVSLADKYNWIA
ncbi:MAG: hypothetical protein EBS86_13075, partial [Crocinitomicaceae bacterium]|nr:hypothetical protein [Crocinitomicaceae bacterium]